MRPAAVATIAVLNGAIGFAQANHSSATLPASLTHPVKLPHTRRPMTTMMMLTKTAFLRRLNREWWLAWSDLVASIPNTTPHHIDNGITEDYREDPSLHVSGDRVGLSRVRSGAGRGRQRNTKPNPVGTQHLHKGDKAFSMVSTFFELLEADRSDPGHLGNLFTSGPTAQLDQHIRQISPGIRDCQKNGV